MATSTLVDTLAALQSTSASTTEQIAALKALRNEVIGHAARKAALVRAGALEALAISLGASTRGRGKQRLQDANGVALGKPPAWLDQDEVCLQALTVLDSLASGGPAFVLPLRASGIVSLLVLCLSPTDNAPRIVQAALKAFVTICDMACQSQPSESLSTSGALDSQISYSSIVRPLVDILSQNAASPTVQSQVSLVSQLIHHTALVERHRAFCVRAGLLDLLAARLAAFYEKQGFSTLRSASKTKLPPAPTQRMLPYLLQAIATLVQKSRYRVARLLFSPYILSVMPLSPFNSLDMGATVQRPFDHVDLHLPKIHSGSSKEDRQHSKAFPALSAVQSRDQKYAALMDFENSGYNTPMRPVAPEFQESSLVSWLIYTLRNEQPVTRMEAASLLTTIARAGFLGKGRDRQLALLVVPLLVSAMDETTATANDQPDSSSPSVQADERLIRARAPKILAELIKDSPRLQEAAVEAHAIPKVSKMLKQTFGTISARVPLWSADTTAENIATDGENSPRALGPAGIRPDILHVFKCRESALVLVSALGHKDDKYRRALADHGIVAVIIDSLAPLQADAIADLSRSARRDKLDVTYGNPNPVLLAACNAARSLSRAVSLLRTSLIDACIATPIFSLLNHSNVSVLIAATDVICNLIVDYSPMRQNIIDQGAIKTLCDHAHSADSRIRLVSLWALKHLVHESPNEIKEQTFEALGTGWLVQIITGGSSNGVSATSRTAQFSMGAANAAGERVDILNAVDEPMDTSEEHGEATQTSDEPYSSTTPGDEIIPPIFPPNSELATLAEQHRQRLASIRDEERSTAAQAQYRDEQQIQVQGLDFIRNLIVGINSSAMIDMLFTSLGPNRVFDIIAAKLRPAGLDSLDAASLSPSAAAQLHTPTEILISACFVCVHIAAGEPKHRLQLMSQPGLLRLMLPLLRHPDPAVRVSCVWCVANLTWVDDQNDAPAARQRAFELRAMGFEDELRALHHDESLDVRERAMTAVSQIEDLVSGEGNARRMER